jgi:hypothetical protein
MHSSAVEHHLKLLSEDCARVDGKPFTYFLCPILGVDENVPLCMGHIVNDACPNSFPGRVVQREDVDHFYGSIVEADFTGLVQAWSKDPKNVLLDPVLSKKMKPRFLVGGEEWKHHHDLGRSSPKHTKIALHFDDGEPLPWVLHKSPGEVAAAGSKALSLAFGMDCRLAALVSLIKAAHLTLFSLLGYSYALSAAGIEIGPMTLGRFFKQHGREKPADAKKSAVEFFRPFVNMMRPLDGYGGGDAPRGTIEDRRAEVCFTPESVPFGIVIYVRTDQRVHAMMMPVFDDVCRVVAYHRFLNDDNQSVRVHVAQFNVEEKRLVVSQQSREVTWPKGDVTFSVD